MSAVRESSLDAESVLGADHRDGGCCMLRGPELCFFVFEGRGGGLEVGGGGDMVFLSRP